MCTNQKNIIGLKCMICGELYDSSEVEYVCPKHGNEGVLDVLFDYDYIQHQFEQQPLSSERDTSIWRYKFLLPIQENCPKPVLHIGNTPLYFTKRLAQHIGMKNLWLKDEGRQATASLKDRASAIAILKAQEKKAKVITTASTGFTLIFLTKRTSKKPKKRCTKPFYPLPTYCVIQVLFWRSAIFGTMPLLFGFLFGVNLPIISE